MKKKKTERGQAIVLIALAIVGLFGLTAISIDGGNAFSDRRHAQNAADNAAMSSALAKVRGNNWTSIGESIASANGYNNDGTTNSVDLYSPPISGPYAGDDEYLQVIITSHVSTYFAPVVGVNKLTNVVEAIARAKPATEMFDGNAVVSVCQTGSTMNFSGGASANITGGGVFVNSSDNDAFDTDGGVTVGLPSIHVVGGIGNTDPSDFAGATINTGVEQVPTSEYDYSWLDELIDCAAITAKDNFIINGTTLTPNADIIRIDSKTKFPPKDIENLGAGIYCLENGFSINDSKATLIGNDVTFVLLAGDLTLNGGTVELNSPQTGSTAGLLFYQPATNTDTLTINGNASLRLGGTIIATGAELKLTGTSGTHLEGQTIACETKISGSSEDMIHYDNEDNIDNPPKIELAN